MIKLVLILLLISQQFIPIHPGIYECTDNGDYYKLVLNEDSTYQYYSPALLFDRINNRKTKGHTDYSVNTGHGIWKYKNDTLILIDSTIKIYSKTGITSEYINGQNYFSVSVIDEKSNPYSDIFVSLNYSKHWEKTDSAGLGKFEYKEIKKILSDWTDTIPGWHMDTLSTLSFGPDTNTGHPKFEIHNVKKTKSLEDIPILYIQIKNYEKGGWLCTFDNKKAHVNHFTVIQDFNPIIKKEIRIRKLPVVDNIIIFSNPTGRQNGHTIKLENKN